MVHFLFLRKVERFAIQCMNSLLNSMETVLTLKKNDFRRVTLKKVLGILLQ